MLARKAGIKGSSETFKILDGFIKLNGDSRCIMF